MMGWRKTRNFGGLLLFIYLFAISFYSTNHLMKESSSMDKIVILGLSILTFSLFTLLTILISREITQSLKKLTEGIKRFESGEENHEISINSGDEFSVLSDAFNSLTQNLYARKKGIKAYRKRLKEKDEEMTIILHKMADGVLILDLDGKIVKCNPELSEMFGFHYLTSTLIGKDCSEVFGEEINSLVLKSYQFTSQVSSAEILLKNGRVGKAQCTFLYPKKIDSKKIGIYSAFVLVIRDITEEKEVLNMKDSFVSTVSHELRTPLASILGFTNLVRKRLENKLFPFLPQENKKLTKSSKQTLDNLEIVLQEGERLGKLINNVLDIAKMESGEIDWDMGLHSMEELLEQAMGATSSLFENKDISIKKEVSKNLPEIFCDRDQIIQVLINLISNAEKFTNRGTVTCQITAVEKDIEITVSDTGMGISETNLPKVFEKFKQVGNILENKPKGSGLGLYISKQIVEKHKGKIWVESDLNLGSKFTFRIPQKDILSDS
jgi:PAS domain S-box-containing protein